MRDCAITETQSSDHNGSNLRTVHRDRPAVFVSTSVSKELRFLTDDAFALGRMG
jgi:hypothetical protein